MRIGKGNVIGLLMAPERLPSCFSHDDGAEAPAVRSTPSTELPRLNDAHRRVARALHARLTRSRKLSAAAW